MPNLSTRSTLPEKMDQPDVAEKEVMQALSELEMINKYLGGYNVILSALKQLSWPNSSVTILDLGCGGGDTLRAISKWADRNKRSVQLIGIDMNPIMTSYAQSKSQQLNNISFVTADIFDEKVLDLRADIVISSLFCHHFDDDNLIKMVRRMNQLASKAVIINDLHRHWFAYHSINFLTSLFSKTYLVKHDAKLSVARSLIKQEWKKTLEQAELKNYKIRWKWAWRWEIIIEK